MYDCEVCGKFDDEKPMCFRGERWCSEVHRKMIVGELPRNTKIVRSKLYNVK